MSCRVVSVCRVVRTWGAVELHSLEPLYDVGRFGAQEPAGLGVPRDMGVERDHQPKVAQRGPPAEQERVLGLGVECQEWFDTTTGAGRNATLEFEPRWRSWFGR
jgi:hypothetical protein